MLDEGLEDLERAIERDEHAILNTPPSHPDMPALLNDLGLGLDDRFKRVGELADLEKAIGYIALAVSLTPQGHSDMPTWLSNLGFLLKGRFDRLGELADLDEAAEHMSQAISLTPQDHSDMPYCLNNLGTLLKSRFDRLGELTDLDEGIEYINQAVSLTPEEHPTLHVWLNNLGSLCHSRFLRLSELEDLEKAIAFQSRAVSLTPEGHPSMPTRLNNLGSSLQSRFAQLEEFEDLYKSINYLTRAVSLTPQGHLDMPNRLNNLGFSLDSRFVRLGELADIDASIEFKSQAVSITPQDHTEMPNFLRSLGSSLGARFERLGELADLEKAIDYQNQALSLTPQGHSAMYSCLSRLGVSLLSRFQRLGTRADLDKAIECLSLAVSLAPQGHSDTKSCLNSLGLSLNARFDRAGELADLEKAIECISQAVSLTPQGHPNMPALLNNLGAPLESRFKQLGELADLDKSIKYRSQAVSLTPKDHPDMPSWLINLGSAYNTRFGCSRVESDIHKYLECLQQAAESPGGSPFAKFHSALQWARASLQYRPSSSLVAYQQAMSLLPQRVWLGSAIGNRYRSIVDVGSLTTEAAAVAIWNEEFGLALEWLEEGRSIVWKQMLQLRTPLDDLAAVKPELALQLQQVARELDLVSSAKPMQESIAPNNHSLEQAAQQHRRLAEKWEKLVDQARRTLGFETFLRPLTASKLLSLAHSGPVVVVNLDKSRCDALVVRSGFNEILHVPLGLSYEMAIDTRVQLDQLVRSRDPTQRKPNITQRKGKDAFEKTLAMLWIEVVKPVLVSLGYMELSFTGNLPHITWCTTGPLSFFPLHAAGDYDSGEMIFKYVVSSYTPTISALLSPPSRNTFSGLLAVGQSSTLGLSPLPGTIVELNQIEETSQGHLVTRLDDDLATPTSVMAAMQAHSWVHLACHAMQDPTNPMQSAFYLHGGALDLATITQKQLKHADFAFLSACQTATGDKSLSDEAVHLAAGMLMAGYRTVIATMWSIGDKEAPLMAKEVYRHLLGGGVPDARRAAVAVHKATEQLRGEVGMKAFAKWVPYIHIGL